MKGDWIMRETGKPRNQWIQVLICGAGAAILTVLLSMLCSVLILREILPEERTDVYSAIICAVSVVIACLFGTERKGSQEITTYLVIGSVYFAITLLTKVLAFPGGASGILMRAIVIFGSTILLWIFRQKSNEGRVARRRKSYR